MPAGGAFYNVWTRYQPVPGHLPHADDVEIWSHVHVRSGGTQNPWRISKERTRIVNGIVTLYKWLCHDVVTMSYPVIFYTIPWYCHWHCAVYWSTSANADPDKWTHTMSWHCTVYNGVVQYRYILRPARNNFVGAALPIWHALCTGSVYNIMVANEDPPPHVVSLIILS